MRIIILSCSNLKISFSTPRPALEVYDGPYFKTIRKLKREGRFPDNVTVLIISAEYGLLRLEDKIKIYDRRIDRQRAEELNKPVINKLLRIIKKNPCEELIINLGSDYYPIVEGIEQKLQGYCKVKFFSGTIIQRRQHLKEYLLNA